MQQLKWLWTILGVNKAAEHIVFSHKSVYIVTVYQYTSHRVIKSRPEPDLGMSVPSIIHALPALQPRASRRLRTALCERCRRLVFQRGRSAFLEIVCVSSPIVSSLY